LQASRFLHSSEDQNVRFPSMFRGVAKMLSRTMKPIAIAVALSLCLSLPALAQQQPAASSAAPATTGTAGASAATGAAFGGISTGAVAAAVVVVAVAASMSSGSSGAAAPAPTPSQTTSTELAGAVDQTVVAVDNASELLDVARNQLDAAIVGLTLTETQQATIADQADKVAVALAELASARAAAATAAANLRLASTVPVVGVTPIPASICAATISCTAAELEFLARTAANTAVAAANAATRAVLAIQAFRDAVAAVGGTIPPEFITALNVASAAVNAALASANEAKEKYSQVVAATPGATGTTIAAPTGTVPSTGTVN
jgi:hypothetical protein